jgi:hypothetical protein
MVPRALVALLAVGAAAGGASSASASERIDLNATGVRLAVDDRGRALLTYRAGGRARRVLVWGAINARHPHPRVPQVRFRKRYSTPVRSIRNTCAPYDGPALKWFLLGCKAADGCYWAVQRWQRMLPGRGAAPTARQAAWELRLSHWKGPLPQLQIKLDWAYRRYDHLYGTYTYLGHPIFGFRVTRNGAPRDGYGRNLYLDTLNSAHGRGWRREAGFLAQNPRGNFCYGFFRRGSSPIGKGERYRATVIGPGVTPDAYWESSAPGPYDREADRVMNDEQRALSAGSKYCRPN